MARFRACPVPSGRRPQTEQPIFFPECCPASFVQGDGKGSAEEMPAKHVISDEVPKAGNVDP